MDKTMVSPLISPMAPLPTHLSPKGKLRKSLHCLLCDIYGTLFISGSGDLLLGKQQKTPSRGIDELLARYQLHMPPTTLIHCLHTAIQAEHQKAHAIGIDYPEIKIEELWSDILPFKNAERIRAFAVEFEMIMNPVWPMPGLNELILLKKTAVIQIICGALCERGSVLPTRPLRVRLYLCQIYLCSSAAKLFFGLVG